MTDALLDIARRTLDAALKQGADEADVLGFDHLDTTVRARLGKSETIEQSQSRGVGLRVLIKAKKGYRQAMVSSSDTSEKALNALVEKAVTLAKLAPADEYIAMAREEQLAGQKAVDLDLADSYRPDVQELLAWALEAEEAALGVRGVTNSDGVDASFGKGEAVSVLSNGFAERMESTSYSLSASMIAGEGLGMETDYDYTSRRHKADMKPGSFVGKSAAERAVKRLNSRKVKTCKAPVVFENRVAARLMGSLASAINGASIARGTSFLQDSLGKQVFASHITVIDDPRMKRGLASEAFDAEGIATRAMRVIDGGVLTTWLLDIATANQLGMQTTGHASRGLSSAPSPGASNFYLQPGERSVKELIADIKQGFFVTETFGMGVNNVTGDYSQGASGFWIENGEIVFPVSEMTIASNLKDMFLNLTPANDLEFNGSKNSPTVRIEGMTVAGK